jgi:hypothetical protein
MLTWFSVSQNVLTGLYLRLRALLREIAFRRLLLPGSLLPDRRRLRRNLIKWHSWASSWQMPTVVSEHGGDRPCPNADRATRRVGLPLRPEKPADWCVCATRPDCTRCMWVGSRARDSVVASRSPIDSEVVAPGCDAHFRCRSCPDRARAARRTYGPPCPAQSSDGFVSSLRRARVRLPHRKSILVVSGGRLLTRELARRQAPSRHRSDNSLGCDC